MKSNYTAPKFSLPAFNCPYCGAYANMSWYEAKFYDGYMSLGSLGLKAANCSCCRKSTVWFEDKMIIPSFSTAPMPNDDMPEKIVELYNEAREIVSKSPRGAAALLRLALQLLCDDLVPENKNLNDKIAELVKKGLSPQLQKAFDIVRIVGNNAVHPGEINIKDNPEICTKLFDLINIIVDQMITRPKEIDDFYNNTIPEANKKSIKNRDKKE